VTRVDKEQSEGISALWRLVLDMNRQLKITLQSMSCKSGVSYSAMAVIFRLEHQRTMKMNDIADYLSITLGAATSLVDKLEEQGWVERTRCQEDRRIIFVRLTEEGMAKLLALRNEFVDQACGVFEPVPAEKIAQMSEQLQELVRYMGEYNRLVERSEGRS
jgi:DNA-binding MarR family transcriptional regulator